MHISAMLLSRLHPALRHTPPRLRQAVWKHAYCVPQHGFIYFRVPKAANSTVVLALDRQMRGEGAAGNPKRAAERMPLLAPLPAFTFSFVRNPFARVLSAYLDKVAEGNAKYLRVLGLAAAPDFMGFLRALESGALAANAHWAPQADLIPVRRLSFLGRVENLRQDLPEVLTRIFGPGEYEVPESPFRVTGADARMREHYGPGEVALVRRLYARDFALYYPGADDPV